MNAEILLHPTVAQQLWRHRQAAEWLRSAAVLHADSGRAEQAEMFRRAARAKAEQAARYALSVSPLAIPDYPG